MKKQFFAQNLPTTLYSVEQARKLDCIAIKTQSIEGITLMTRAGKDAFSLLQSLCPQMQSITVFCGTGNNAGDAYVVAHEALLAGKQANVIALSPTYTLAKDALLAYQTYIDAGGVVANYKADLAVNSDVIVDGLLGIGINRDLTGLYAQAVTTINQSNSLVLSLDIPSGLQANSGHVMGMAVKANYTITFIALKKGLFTGLAADYCGNIYFSSLAVPNQIYQEIYSNTQRIINANMPPRKRCLHKGNNGHVLVIGGDQGFGGAVLLAAEGSARAGAGLVSIATHATHANSIAIIKPELMCFGVATKEDFLPLLQRASVYALGPGLGKSQWAQQLLHLTLNTQKPVVVDADALNLLAENPIYCTRWILTPHPGEAARLLRCSVIAIQQDRFRAVSKLQQKYGGVVILKGVGTLIANGKMIYVVNTGNPGMASGGMGDLLTGIVAALIAQGWSLIDAATTAVYIHGKAADRASTKGERGLLATDLLTYIQQLVNNK